MSHLSKIKTVFERIDESDYHIGSFYPFLVLRNVTAWRIYFRFIALFGFCLWLVYGFDSVIEQTYPLIDNFIPLLMGKISFSEIVAMMQEVYGKGSHFSAVVIYGVAWLYLSDTLEKNGITKSFNFFSSMLLTFLNMGIFEIAWNRACAYYQNLPWLMLQTSNIPQYYAWIGVGLLFLLYSYYYGFKLNFSNSSTIFVALAIITWGFWVYFPLPTQQINVITTEGLWTSSKLFPQTLYTVDLDPTDNVYKGVFYYVENNWVHLTNVLAKIFTTSAIVLICSLRKKPE